MPPYLPARTYNLYVCVPPYGCGYLPGGWSVPLAVSGLDAVAPARGPASGGTLVTLAATGLELDPMAVSITFGAMLCDVVSVDSRGATCRTRALPAAQLASLGPSDSLALPLSLVPCRGCAQLSLPSTTFTVTASQAALLTGVRPGWGSTSGGTVLTLYGSGFTPLGSPAQPGLPTVSLGSDGSLLCGNVTLLSDAQLSCVAPALPPGQPAGLPLAVRLAVPGRGPAAVVPPPNDPAITSVLTVSFTYADRWSEPATWARLGRAAPEADDEVELPEGASILLDVSPPPLGGLRLSGSLLVFQPDAPELELRVRG
jgi:hypothetical protein